MKTIPFREKAPEAQGRLTHLPEITELGTGEAHILNDVSKHFVNICSLSTQAL